MSLPPFFFALTFHYFHPQFLSLIRSMAAQLVQTRHNKWLAVLLMKWMGYSSFAAAIVSIIVYCYKKQMAIEQVIKKPVDGLHMKRKPLEITIARSTSSLANLHASRQLLTPPPSPQPAAAANKSWSTRLIYGVISVTRKRKRMTISLKNVSKLFIDIEYSLIGKYLDYLVESQQ